MSAPEAATTPPVTEEAPQRSRTGAMLQDMLSSSWLMTLAAIVAALVIGAVLIVASSPEVRAAASYLFARPSDFFSAAWESVSSAYLALFQGAIYDGRAQSGQRAIRPITETMTIATPLTLAALGIGIGFRSGLFNIGAQGQIVLGAIVATWVGFSFGLPAPVHILLALVGAAVGGAVWAGIAGLLKARLGAHEVIVTIMLNNIATYLVAYLLTLRLFASSTPQVSRPVAAGAMLPSLPDPFRLHLGFVLMLLIAVGVWWLMERSVIGFQFRAVGSNPGAARTAGMSVPWVTVLVMAIAGGLAGIGGAMQVLGTERTLTSSVAGSMGFDAITVALLGRSKPGGTVLAGLLFGAFAAGGRLMQTRTGTPIDLVLVLQSVIVLFIAAPPLVRAIFRLPSPEMRSTRTKEVPG